MIFVNYNFRELELVCQHANSETMNNAGEKKCDKAQGGDRDQDEDNLRDAEVRALKVAMKEDPLPDVRDPGAADAEVAAAGATTGCGDRGSLSSSGEEDMVSATSTLSTQRKVFSSFFVNFSYFWFQVHFNSADCDDINSPTATLQLRRLLLPTLGTPAVTRSLTNSPRGTRYRTEELGVDTFGKILR